MKGYFPYHLVMLLLIGFNSVCGQSQKSFISNFNPSLMWFEMGKSMPFAQDQISNYEPGLKEYMSNTKGEVLFSFFGAGFYYKDKFGFEVLFSSRSFKATGNDFNAYLADRYPDHFQPSSEMNYSYSMDGTALRLCYRKHFKHFFIEPKFQFGINSFKNFFPTFRLKEMGSNQYVQYRFTDTFSGPKHSYHALFNIAKRFDPFKMSLKVEVALFTEFMICPIKQDLLIEEYHYGQTGMTSVQRIELLNPSFSAGVGVKLFFDREGN